MWRRNRTRASVKTSKGCWIPLGDEVEAFVHGELARAWGTKGPMAPWLHLNQLAHGSLLELTAQAGPSAGRADDEADDAWAHMRTRLAEEILQRVRDADELRDVQAQCLWPLESELIEAEDQVVPTPGEFYRLVHGALGPLVDSPSTADGDERGR